MPYNDEGVYKHEVEVPAAGDSLRKAAFELAYAVETYLFDHNRPGYDNKAFLDWSVQHFLATHQSSGMMANQEIRWNPERAAVDEYDTHTPKEGETWTRGAVMGGLHYSKDALDSKDIDTSGKAKGEAELYASNEVVEPWQASMINEDAVVVPARSHDDVKPTDTSDSRVEPEVRSKDADAKPAPAKKTAAQKDGEK